MTVLAKFKKMVDGKIGLQTVFLVLAVLTLFDIFEDYTDGASFLHLAFEALIVLTCTAGFFLVVDGLTAKVKKMTKEIASEKKETRHWKSQSQKLAQGLSTEIDNQFELWQFTETEKEIGLLLLKGLAFKEIATVLNKKERTVRQQALLIYRKSSLQGRAEFSAFFLEDLLLPTKTFAQRTESSISLSQNL